MNFFIVSEVKKESVEACCFDETPNHPCGESDAKQENKGYSNILPLFPTLDESTSESKDETFSKQIKKTLMDLY